MTSTIPAASASRSSVTSRGMHAVERPTAPKCRRQSDVRNVRSSLCSSRVGPRATKLSRGRNVLWPGSSSSAAPGRPRLLLGGSRAAGVVQGAALHPGGRHGGDPGLDGASSGRGRRLETVDASRSTPGQPPGPAGPRGRGPAEGQGQAGPRPKLWPSRAKSVDGQDLAPALLDPRPRRRAPTPARTGCAHQANPRTVRRPRRVRPQRADRVRGRCSRSANSAVSDGGSQAAAAAPSASCHATPTRDVLDQERPEQLP
jgi:hypothetical protein